VRLFLIATVVAGASISGAAAQQQPCPRENLFGAMANGMDSARAAQRDFEHAVCEYKNCLAANQNNVNACEGLRHIMDASAQAAGHSNGSR
jgi:hypothetical protein